MKIRNGFVSNSSSSSFIVITKGEELSKPMIEKAFEKAKDTPFKGIIGNIIDILYRKSVTEKYNNQYEIGELSSLLSNYGCENLEEFKNEYLGELLKDKDLKENYKYYFGSAYDDGDVGEVLLCNIEMNYEDDNIIIVKYER